MYIAILLDKTFWSICAVISFKKLIATGEKSTNKSACN